MNSPSSSPRTWSQWLLGTDRKQRVRVEHSLTAALVYLVCIGLMAYAVWAGFMRADQAVALSSALTWIVGAFAITGPVHGSTMMLLTLVLMFGTFTLDARGARIAGVYVVLLMGVVIVFKVRTEPEHYPIKLEWVNFMLTAIIMPTVSKLAAQLSVMRNRLKLQRNELAAALERIQELATRDELTKLFNRRHMNEILAQHQRRLVRSGHHRFCLAILDLDHFKQINDTFGHAGGDEVLCRFAQVAQEVLRTTDVLARWGGEEFLVLLTDTTPEQGVRGIERLRERLAEVPALSSDPARRIAFSAGVASFQVGETIEACIERADKALYRAKGAGRKRIYLCDSDAPPTADMLVDLAQREASDVAARLAQHADASARDASCSI